MGQSFHDLRIWQTGYDNLMELYRITGTYPNEERFSLTQDTRRSGNSIIANIAESHGRYFYADKIRVLYIARGEIEETRSHLVVARGRGYIDQETFEKMDNAYKGLGIGLNSFIGNLDKQKRAQQPKRSSGNLIA